MDEHDPIDPFALLRWNAQTGFDLDMTAVIDESVIRLVGVPVPADGTRALAEGVSLYPLDILFKAHVDWNGANCQLRAATIRLLGEAGDYRLELDGEVEDPESGDGARLVADVFVDVPLDAPESGGPVPVAQTEDELDWEDETTIETLLGDVDVPIHTESRRRARTAEVGEPDDVDEGRAPKGMESMGLKRLLAALTRPGEGASEDDDLDDDLDDDDDMDFDPEEEDFDDEPAAEAPPRKLAKQLNPLEREAYDFLRLLVDNDHLELSDGHEVDALVKGVAPILSGRAAAESKAARLSAWLLDQPEVDELFLDDEELAELLEQW